MKKIGVLSVLLVLLSILSVSVLAEFEVKVEPIKETITIEGTAEFNLVIINRDAAPQRFRIYYTSLEWDVHAEPRSDSTVEVGGNSYKSILIKATPIQAVIGQHLIPINVRSETTDDKAEVTLAISIKSEEEVIERYAPVVRGTITMNREIDPREEATIKIDLENKNPRDLDQLKVILGSSLINKEYQTELDPWEKKTLEFKIKFDPLEKPLKDELILYLEVPIAGNKTFKFKAYSFPYEIMQYGSVTEKKDETKKFFKTTSLITLTNEGNLIGDEVYRAQTSLLNRLFTSAKPKPDEVIKSEGKTYYAWNLHLEPTQSIEIKIVVSYRPIFYIILLIIIGTILYYVLRSPIVIKKSATKISMREGGISEVKIILTVRNIGYHAIDDITIKDRVTNIADIKKEFDIGTLPPVSILKNDRKGTLIKWHIDSLERNEERVLSYGIESKLSILGSFYLPLSTALFKDRGILRKTSSNRLVLKA